MPADEGWLKVVGFAVFAVGTALQAHAYDYRHRWRCCIGGIFVVLGGIAMGKGL
jgi:hypothetical protein